MRLALFRDTFAHEMTPDQAKIVRSTALDLRLSLNHPRQVTIIAEQEETHATWVGELLAARGQASQLLHKKERYWDKTITQVKSFDTGAAVAAHAEGTRCA